MKQIGRKPVLNQSLIKVISMLIEDGRFEKSVAETIGVSEVTWHKWKNKGKAVQSKLAENASYKPDDREQLYLDFIEAFNHSSAVFESKVLENIRQAAYTDWRAVAWILERRFRNNWGRVKGIK